MLVEDNEFARSIISRTFQTSHYGVIEVASGNDVLESFQVHAESIDLLVLDIDLPGKNGLQCRKEIRQSHPSMPVLLITGSLDFSPEECEDPHSVLLRKPFKMTEIIALADKMLAKPPTH